MAETLRRFDAEGWSAEFRREDRDAMKSRCNNLEGLTKISLRRIGGR